MQVAFKKVKKIFKKCASGYELKRYPTPYSYSFLEKD